VVRFPALGALATLPVERVLDSVAVRSGPPTTISASQSNRRGVLPRSLTITPREFETSDLGSDNLAEPLTNSANRPGDGEKRPPVTATGAHIWPAMADAETNGERRNARNVGQLGTCGNGCAVNKLRGKRFGERNWLLRQDSNLQPFG